VTRGVLRATAFILLALSMLLLQGCLITRLQSVQEQSCDLDRYFSMSFEEGMSITFLEPVLLYQDIEFLAGITPEFQGQEGSHFQASYLLKKTGISDRPDIPVNLEFSSREDELLLVQLSVLSPLFSIFDPTQQPLITDAACGARLPSWGTRIEVPISDYYQAMAHTRGEILELAGSPTSTNLDGRELVYEFVLSGEGASELNGSVSLVYDVSGEKLLRSRARFYHYVMDADFDRGIAWGALTL
jgi:hypothetical protein